MRRTLRLRASHLKRSRPVSGKVIVTAEPVVIHPRRRRDRGVPNEDVALPVTLILHLAPGPGIVNDFAVRSVVV